MLWKTINDITKFKNKQQESIKEIVNDENKTTTDPVEMANTFNTYFSTIGSKLASKIDKPSNNCNYSYNSFISNKITFFLNPITMYDIVKHINKLNPIKSSGPCKIPIKYIKMSMNIISPLLAKLYNQCIIEETFPSILKIVQVVPTYKNGPNEKCCKYRPISLLSPFSKIFEKCIYEQLYSYLIKYNILAPNQFGFKQNCSTSQAVRQLYDELIQNIDQKQIRCHIFLDLSKAFDTVDHKILIRKLDHYGICGLPQQLIKSYLDNRLQFTSVAETTSNLTPITCGVPQGSTLGPLLFLLYVYK